MLDYVGAIQRESDRLFDLVAATPWSAPVPSCPGWTVADLTWHVAEVQHAWASVAGDLLMERSDVPDLVRPADDELAELLRDTSEALVNAVGFRNPSDACWSWHDAGRNVGWVRRRQAHEALIHRLDAELAAGTSQIEVDETLAADGVDEILTLFLDASDLPDWSTFEEQGQVIAVRLVAPERAWFAQPGRFHGTSPTSGTTYDEEAIRLVGAQPVTTTVAGTGASLDRWLWGRGTIDDLSVEGDPVMATWIRTAARHATQ